MTLAELENLMGRAGLTQHQTRELLPAIHAYATSQSSAAIDVGALNEPAEPARNLTWAGAGEVKDLWHALTLSPEVGSRCGAVGVNTTNTQLVNCPDCLKGTP